jgi:hypothetical protein
MTAMKSFETLKREEAHWKEVETLALLMQQQWLRAEKTAICVDDCQKWNAKHGSDPLDPLPMFQAWHKTDLERATQSSAALDEMVKNDIPM